MFVVW